MRVLIADDHALVRSALRRLLERTGLVVVGEAGNGQAAVELAARLAPDVVLMDVEMPLLDGIEATRAIVLADPKVGVVIVTAHARGAYVAEAIRAGACGYVLKASSATELVLALDAVRRGEIYVSSGVAAIALADYARRLRGGAADADLTTRERDVVRLAVEGKTSARIARSLSVSPRTIETHRRNAMKKLGVRTIAQLTRSALRHGLVTRG